VLLNLLYKALTYKHEAGLLVNWFIGLLVYWLIVCCYKVAQTTYPIQTIMFQITLSFVVIQQIACIILYFTG